jgi:ribonuclease III
MAHKIGKESPVLCEQEVFSMDALTLAYIGDACWSFFIRKALIDTGIYNVQILNSLASEIVSARWQSRILFEIRELLNERELKVAKRARNTSSHVPKSATVEEYRESTAFEALLGYLYLSGQKQRLDFILEKSLKYVAGEMSHEN